MAKHREFVVDCENVTEDVWVPSRLWFLGDEQKIVRCRDCKYYHDKIQACQFFADDAWDNRTYVTVEPDGFCKWGEPNE